MLLDDAASIRAALATMNPAARSATQDLSGKILRCPELLQDPEELQRQTILSLACAFTRAGYDLEDDRQRFTRFLEDHASNVLDLAVSIIYCVAKDQQRRERWGKVGKVAALVGAVALGAFFG